MNGFLALFLAFVACTFARGGVAEEEENFSNRETSIDFSINLVYQVVAVNEYIVRAVSEFSSFLANYYALENQVLRNSQEGRFNPVSDAINDNGSLNLDVNDINGLNYALALEHLEYAFYTKYQAMFSQANFTAAGYPSNTYSYLNMILTHEGAHVTFLSDTIASLGGSAAPACSYDFDSALGTPIVNVTQYIALAIALEETGVSAYDGAIDTFTNVSLRTGAASIATIEARHAAYLNTIQQAVLQSGSGPFPNSFDSPLLPTQVLSAVTADGFIVDGSCPSGYNPNDNLPLVVTFSNDDSTTPSPDNNNSAALSVSVVTLLVSALVSLWA